MDRYNPGIKTVIQGDQNRVDRKLHPRRARLFIFFFLFIKDFPTYNPLNGLTAPDPRFSSDSR